MRLTKEEIRIGKRKVAELKRNPTKITEAARRGADDLFKKQQEFEKSQDRSIANERQGLAKDVASYVHNHVNGVGTLFNGIGDGKAKTIICAFPGCGIHESQMFCMKDNQWYCGSHKNFGNLTKEKKEKEICHA